MNKKPIQSSHEAKRNGESVKRQRLVTHWARSPRYKKRVWRQKHKVGPKLVFYDLRNKRKFETDNYKTVKKGGRRFAVTTTPSGGKAHRIV